MVLDRAVLPVTDPALGRRAAEVGLPTGASDAAVVLNHRGAAALEDGNPADALARFATAAVLAPHRASVWNNSGEALHALGRSGDAERAYRRALRLRPAYPKALAGLGRLLRNTRRVKMAARALVRALVVDPAFAEGWSIVAAILHDQRREERRRLFLRRAVFLDPMNVAARIALALGESEDPRDAGAHLERALALAPAHRPAYGGYAGFLVRQGGFERARMIHARLRRLFPSDGDADAGDSIIATLRGDFARAMALGRHSLLLQPGSAAAHINLSLAEHGNGLLERARRSSERAIRLQPDNDVARFNLSMVLLALGDFVEGWRLYEARWRMERTRYPDHAPPWPGGDPAGRSFLLVAEQGQGDTLHFVRYAALLAACGARVHLMVQPALTRLLSGIPGVASVVPLDDPPPVCDACVPLMSLPLLFGTTLATIPAATPYLRAAEADRRFWGGRLAGERRLKVGLVWAGSAHDDQINAHMVDRRRSLPLAALAPLAGVPGVAFYSLQKGPPAAEARTAPAGVALIDWMDEMRDFADTAALVEHLDLVISVDTSVCHLAGALARPVWVLSRHDACWRWLRDRPDSPWYPTLRLFRQDAPGDWEPVVARVRDALCQRVAAVFEE